MKALDKKLVRDLLRLRGQVITIALVVACGISGYAAIVGTYQALLRARDAFYDETRFADVFADVIRAPLRVRDQLSALPGVAQVATRVRAQARLILPSLREPLRGEVVSVDARRPAALDRLRVRRGRLPHSGRSDEAALLHAFADAHRIALGERIALVIEGVRHSVRVVGVVLSPDYVFPLAPGEVAFDPKSYGVVFMDAAVLARALRLSGSFTHASLRLQPRANVASVLQATERVLAPFGGRLPRTRDKHPSNALVSGELAQLESMSTSIPLIFLGVAAFLVNVVLARLVQLERPEIAALKAMGYGNLQVGAHYVKLVAVVVWLGAALGLGAGVYFGDALTDLYGEFFSFPELRFRLDPGLFAQALGVSSLAALAGAVGSARSVTRLPPAEAMRPPAPLRYRHGLPARRGGARVLGPAATMVWRELSRRPLRLVLSALGIAMAIAVLVVGRFSADAIDFLMEVQFVRAQREDVAITFDRALPERVVHEVRALPGVSRTEGLRTVPVIVRNGHARREAALTALLPTGALRRVVDSRGDIVPLPEGGVLLSRKLAEILAARPGDRVELSSLEGAPRARSQLVRGTADDLFGLNVYMTRQALARWLGEAPRLSSVVFRADPRAYPALRRQLLRRPSVLGISRRSELIEHFRRQNARQMQIMTLTLTCFASIIAAGVVYNNARVALSLRARDFASLRVLGFRRGEISALLLSELAVQTLLAIAPGMLLGRALVVSVMSVTDPELYRFPVMVSTQTYAFAVSVTLAAALLSALLVRRRLDHLDLIAVLKTRE